MTRFALPGKCGTLGARGLISSARACSDNRCARMPGNKSEPLTRERIIWRREQPQLEWPAIGAMTQSLEIGWGREAGNSWHANELRNVRSRLKALILNF